MARYFVYILRCSDGTLYTGVTTDLKRRLSEHNAGRGAKYTRGRLPAALVYLEKAPSLRSALRRESKVKRLRRQEKLALFATDARGGRADASLP